MDQFKVYIHSQLLSSGESPFKDQTLKDYFESHSVDVIPFSPPSISSKELEALQDPTSFQVFLCPEALLNQDQPLSEPILQAVQSGKIRIALLNCETPNHSLSPIAMCPKDASKAFQKTFIRQLLYSGYPGVQTLMPSKESRIFSEKIYSDKEFGRKIDQLVFFLEENSIPNVSVHFEIRLWVNYWLSQAFNQNGRRPCGEIQVGVQEKFVALSVKWKTEQDIPSPQEFMTTFPSSSFEKGCFIHFIPEAHSVEILKPIHLEEAASLWDGPCSWDFLKNERLHLIKNSPHLQHLKGIQFQALRTLPEAPEVAQVISATDDTDDSQQFKVQGGTSEMEANSTVSGVTQTLNSDETLVKGSELEEGKSETKISGTTDVTKDKVTIVQGEKKVDSSSQTLSEKPFTSESLSWDGTEENLSVKVMNDTIEMFKKQISEMKQESLSQKQQLAQAQTGEKRALQKLKQLEIQNEKLKKGSQGGSAMLEKELSMAKKRSEKLIERERDLIKKLGETTQLIKQLQVENVKLKKTQNAA